MKLFKKLLPLASVAATAMVVAPMATSCTTSSESKTKVNLDTLINRQYFRKTALKEATEVADVEEGLDLYFHDIAQNKQILIDDFYDDLQEAVWLLGKQITTRDEKNFSLDADFDFNPTSIDAQNHRVSFKLSIKAHVDIHWQQSDLAPMIAFPIDVNLAVEAKNIEFLALGGRYDYFTNKWGFYPDMFMITPGGGNAAATPSQLQIDWWKLINSKIWSINIGLDLESPILEGFDIGGELSGFYNYETIQDRETKDLLDFITYELQQGLFKVGAAQRSAAAILSLAFVPNYMTNVTLSRH